VIDLPTCCSNSKPRSGCGDERSNQAEADPRKEDPGLLEDPFRVLGAGDEPYQYSCHMGIQAIGSPESRRGGRHMIALLALVAALASNVLSGSLVFLLWNYGPASFEAIPEMTWLTGVASYLLLRLLVSPPKIEIDFGANS